jgi:hypothetical protein
MAKIISIGVESEISKRIESYTRRLERLYSVAAEETAKIGVSLPYSADRPFLWSDYPESKKLFDKLVSDLRKHITTTINEAIEAEWIEAAKANDERVRKYLKKARLDASSLERFFNRNLDALEAFQKRTDGNGMNLSKRIWMQGEQFRNQMEMALDVGLGEGKGAKELALDIQTYLKEPEKLFRRIREKETGDFYLSQNAKKYNPGTGVYRSSYQNALRVTRTETNMAYRTSDQVRWKSLDFVVGYEIKRSNNVYACPVCEALAGKYPKNFVWSGWHPNCRCRSIPILASVDEFISHQVSLLSGYEVGKFKPSNEIKEVPKAFTVWFANNKQRIVSASSTPYFVRDNRKTFTFMK